MGSKVKKPEVVCKDFNYLCRELDTLALRILTLTEEQVKCRVLLEEAMKPGFVNIAKARYVMGNKMVGSLQLPTEESQEFKALATVKSSKKKCDLYETVLLELNQLEIENSPKKDTGSTVRRRKKDSNVTDEAKNVEDEVEEEPGLTNPLNWFGVLVPLNLRMAQKCFQSALPLVVECANIQIELFRAQLKFDELLFIKKELL